MQEGRTVAEHLDKGLPGLVSTGYFLCGIPRGAVKGTGKIRTTACYVFSVGFPHVPDEYHPVPEPFRVGLITVQCPTP
jgi:hypothetical protein